MKRTWVYAGIPAFLAAILYLPLLRHSLLQWDDATFIVNNPLLSSLNWENLKGMLAYDRGSYWQPLPLLTHAIDRRIGGGAAWPFFLGNLLLHSANCVLVFFVAKFVFGTTRAHSRPGPSPRRVGPVEPVAEEDRVERAAFLAALLFALHPLHVESVAWASERKDLLFSFFYLSAVLLYVRYTRAASRPALWYGASLAAFGLSLASKAMAVSLPLVLLALDFWPLRRLRDGWRRPLSEKIPHVLLALPVAALALEFSRRIDTLVVAEVSFPLVVLNAFRSTGVYLVQTIVPIGLSPLNPFPAKPDPLFVGSGILALTATLAISAYAYRARHRFPALGTGLIAYDALLLPALGLARIGSRTAAHADRYAYLASIVPLLVIAWWLVRLVGARRERGVALVLVLSLLLGGLSLRQIGFWKDTESLWRRVLAIHPDSHLARSNLAGFLSTQGRLTEALAEYDLAVKTPPPQAVTHNGRGAVLLKMGRFAEAVTSFEAAAMLDLKYATPRRNLWTAYMNLGLPEQALDAIQAAVKIEPGDPEDSNRMGTSYLALRNWKAALAAFDSALYLKPDDPRYRAQRALALAGLGRRREAVEILEKCVLAVPEEPLYRSLLERIRRGSPVP